MKKTKIIENYNVNLFYDECAWEIDKLIVELERIKSNYSDAEKIYLNLSIESGYYNDVTINNIITTQRLETDEEFEARKIKQRELNRKQREKRAALKKQKADEDYKLYLKLKQRFGK